MSGFRKAKAEQAALKIGLYGLAGSGKTFTSLLCAEGLAKITGKRVAFVDTERGTDFYCQPVAARKIHPEAFDFDALYTRSITEVLSSVQGLDPKVYGVVVIDSITHIWEAARAAYSGNQTRAGTIPFHAWGKIKKPYKELMAFLLSSPMHVFILGRQGSIWEENEDTGEMKNVGTKMKAEGETPHEPHILIHMEVVRTKDGESTITAYAEKDRTGVLQGRIIKEPNFDSLVKPIIGLLGDKQAPMDAGESAAIKDAEALAISDEAAQEVSATLLSDFTAQLTLCKTPESLKEVGTTITTEVKKKMTTEHVAALRQKYLETEKRVKG